jgi:hypothetical protein
MEKYNNTPQGAHPQIMLPDGTIRHMTPNEIAMQLMSEPGLDLKTMDERLMPLFCAKGATVPVTRNGIKVNNFWYGRFDEDLRTHQRVTAYASADHPEIAYVHELGRCLDMYEPATPGDFSQFEHKRRLEGKLRNRREAALQKALSSGASALIEAVYMLAPTGTPAPTPTIVGNADLQVRADRLQEGQHRSRRRQEVAAARFSLPAASASDPRRVDGVPAGQASGRPTRRAGRRSLLDSSRSRDALLDTPDAMSVAPAGVCRESLNPTEVQ